MLQVMISPTLRELQAPPARPLPSREDWKTVCRGLSLMKGSLKCALIGLFVIEGCCLLLASFEGRGGFLGIMAWIRHGLLGWSVVAGLCVVPYVVGQALCCKVPPESKARKDIIASLFALASCFVIAGAFGLLLLNQRAPFSSDVGFMFVFFIAFDAVCAAFLVQFVFVVRFYNKIAIYFRDHATCMATDWFLVASILFGILQWVLIRICLSEKTISDPFGLYALILFLVVFDCCWVVWYIRILNKVRRLLEWVDALERLRCSPHD